MKKKLERLTDLRFTDEKGRKIRCFTVRRAVENGDKIYACFTLQTWGPVGPGVRYGYAVIDKRRTFRIREWLAGRRPWKYDDRCQGYKFFMSRAAAWRWIRRTTVRAYDRERKLREVEKKLDGVA